MASDPDADRPASPFAGDGRLSTPPGPGGALAPTGASPPRPWGPWATIGWTILCLALMIVVQFATALAYVAARTTLKLRVEPDEMAKDGNLIALAALLSTPAVIGLIALLVSVRRIPLRDYLALRRPTKRQFALSLAGLAVLLVSSDALSYLLGRPIVPPFMVDTWRSSWHPLLLAALLVAAPLEEEVLMRGFLFQGIAASRWGPGAAIVVSSATWSLLHMQYDLYGVATIFVMGLYLGAVRRRTRSLPLTVLLHGVANAIATAEVAARVEWFS